MAEAATQRTQRRQSQGKPTDSVVVSAREPEATLQPRKDGAKRFAYKPSTLVHESGLIVAQAVHASSETAVVDELMNQHVAAFGTTPKTALFDAGYCQSTVLKDKKKIQRHPLQLGRETRGRWRSAIGWLRRCDSTAGSI